jgi:hypothetical protein
MGVILTITVKDLHQRLRDRSALIFGEVAASRSSPPRPPMSTALGSRRVRPREAAR